MLLVMQIMERKVLLLVSSISKSYHHLIQLTYLPRMLSIGLTQASIKKKIQIKMFSDKSVKNIHKHAHKVRGFKRKFKWLLLESIKNIKIILKTLEFVWGSIYRLLQFWYIRDMQPRILWPYIRVQIYYHCPFTCNWKLFRATTYDLYKKIPWYLMGAILKTDDRASINKRERLLWISLSRDIL